MQSSLNTGLLCSSVGWLNSSDLFFGIYSKFLLRKVVACYGIDTHNLSICRLVFHCVAIFLRMCWVTTRAFTLIHNTLFWEFEPHAKVTYSTLYAVSQPAIWPIDLRSSVIIDELPTIYFRGLDNLIATARSNTVAVCLGFQDFSQLAHSHHRGVHKRSWLR